MAALAEHTHAPLGDEPPQVHDDRRRRHEPTPMADLPHGRRLARLGERRPDGRDDGLPPGGAGSAVRVEPPCEHRYSPPGTLWAPPEVRPAASRSPAPEGSASAP